MENENIYKTEKMDFKTKALRVIEELCEYECIGPAAHDRGERCIPCEIYPIAHACFCHETCPVKKQGLDYINKRVSEWHEDEIRRHAMCFVNQFVIKREI